MIHEHNWRIEKRTGDFVCTKCGMRDTGEGGPHYAANGYHGIIKNKTHFIVGEKGPERVNITPIKGHSKKRSDNSLKQNLGFDPMDVLDW